MKSIKIKKTTYILFACFMACLPMIWPETISKAQIPVKRTGEPMQQVADSLENEKNRMLDSAIQVASTLPQMSKTLTNIRRRNSERSPVSYERPQLLVRYNGDVFEADPEYYKGYLILDYNKFIQGIDTGYTIINELADSPKIEPVRPPKRSWFYRLFHKQ